MTFQSRQNSANKDLHLLCALLLSVPLVFASACGGGSIGGGTPPSNPMITSVTVRCSPTSVQIGQTSQCTAALLGTGSYSSAVTWSAVSGTISSSGLYTAPATIPASASDTINATSTQDSTKAGTAALTITRKQPSGSWQYTGPSGGAAMTVLAEDPSSPNTVYADGQGNGASGLWKSVDSGKTWTPMITNSDLDLTPASDIAVANAGQVIYVASRGSEFHSSTDGGVTWTTSQAVSSGHGLGGMVVDPQNYATVYLSVPGLGVVKSVDKGTTWTLLSSSPVITTGSTVLHNPIEVDPTNTSTLYYGTDHGLYITTDGGSTWTASPIGIASGDVQIRDIAVDPAAPSIIFLLAGITNSTVTDLYESTNAGSSWTPLATGLDAERVVPDPNDPRIVYISGIQFHFAYKSTDGGHTFIASDAGTPTAGSSGGSAGYIGLNGPTGTIIPLKSSPNSFLLISEGAGVYRTDNGAQSWYFSSTGLSAWNGDALAVDPEAPGTMYFGAINGGGVFKSTDNGLTWTNVKSGEGIWDIAVDPFDSTHILAVAWEEGLIASHDGGNTWTNIGSHLPTASSLEIIDGVHFHPQQQGTIFVAASALSASTGGVGFMRSSDGGETFASYNSGLSTTQVGGCLAINPQNPQMLLIADGVGLATSTNGGNTWVETASTVTCPFSVDAKSNPPTIYAASVTSGNANGAKSTDFGKTWTTLSVGPNLIADPSTANSVFVMATNYYGPDIGAWSPDAGTTWYPLLTNGLGQILLEPGGYGTSGLWASGAGLVIAPTSPQVLFVASWTHSMARFEVGP